MITIRGLTKSFAHNYVLRGIDLNVPEGQSLVIFGPNGAGKTTLLRIIAGLTKASSGEVSIGGFSLKDSPAESRRRIGVIGHLSYLYPELTGIENLRFYGKLYELSNLEDRCRSMLERVGLDPENETRLGSYSRGMQQRLSIARALLHDPDLLLFDEPYTGLDQSAIHMLDENLRAIAGEGKTILMTTHDLSQGISLTDRVIVLTRGKFVLDRKSAEIDAESFLREYLEIIGGKGHGASSKSQA